RPGQSAGELPVVELSGKTGCNPAAHAGPPCAIPGHGPGRYRQARRLSSLRRKRAAVEPRRLPLGPIEKRRETSSRDTVSDTLRESDTTRHCPCTPPENMRQVSDTLRESDTARHLPMHAAREYAPGVRHPSGVR